LKKLARKLDGLVIHTYPPFVDHKSCFQASFSNMQKEVGTIMADVANPAQVAHYRHIAIQREKLTRQTALLDGEAVSD